MAVSTPTAPAIFSFFLDQRYGRELNRLIWEELGQRKSVHLDHFDRIIRQVEPGGLGVTMGEFAVWNYFTNTRYRDPYYAEADKYPVRPYPRHRRRRRDGRPRHQPDRCQPAASICAFSRNCARVGSICSLTQTEGRGVATCF